MFRLGCARPGRGDEAGDRLQPSQHEYHLPARHQHRDHQRQLRQVHHHSLQHQGRRWWWCEVVSMFNDYVLVIARSELVGELLPRGRDVGDAVGLQRPAQLPGAAWCLHNRAGPLPWHWALPGGSLPLCSEPRWFNPCGGFGFLARGLPENWLLYCFPFIGRSEILFIGQMFLYPL